MNPHAEKAHGGKVSRFGVFWLPEPELEPEPEPEPEPEHGR